MTDTYAEPEITADERVKLTEIFAQDPIELVQDPDRRRYIIEYLRKIRANIRAAEQSGKRINSKTALTPLSNTVDLMDQLP